MKMDFVGGPLHQQQREHDIQKSGPILNVQSEIHPLVTFVYKHDLSSDRMIYDGAIVLPGTGESEEYHE